MMGFPHRHRAGLTFCFAFSACLAAQSAPQPQAAGEISASWSEHAQRIAADKAALTNCIARTAPCDAKQIGPDEKLIFVEGSATHIRLDWLRVGIARLGTENGAKRDALARALSAHLARLDSPEQALPAANMEQAHGEFTRVLSTREFAPDPPPNWFQRQWEAFKLWLGKVLGSGLMAASNTPAWLRFFFEALLFLVPALLLLLWLLRQVREDRLRAATSFPATQNPAQLPQTEWMALAARFADAQQWREAIHALYWATISGFETRHLWRSNRTRTPREYLRLLDAASPARAALAEQTRLFELTWYGYRAATAADYERAAQLRSAAEAR